jgi:hypothetical protein
MQEVGKCNFVNVLCLKISSRDFSSHLSLVDIISSRSLKKNLETARRARSNINFLTCVQSAVPGDKTGDRLWIDNIPCILSAVCHAKAFAFPKSNKRNVFVYCLNNTDM